MSSSSSSSTTSSSERRIAASRANGKKSRGPVTPAGKARSSRNATRHGLSSSASSAAAPPPPDRDDIDHGANLAAQGVCLTNERPEEFLALHKSLVDQHCPTTATELLLVEEMAVARWRLHRAWLMETALLDTEMDDMTASLEKKYEFIDETSRAALAFRNLTEQSPALSVLQRYESRLSRQFDRCLKRLTGLRLQPTPPAPPVADHAILPNDPNPSNGHLENDHHDQQFQPGLDPDAPLPPTAEGQSRRPAIAPAPRPSEMACLHLVTRSLHYELDAPIASPISRAA